MIHPQIGVHIDLAKEIVRLDKADRLRAIFQPFQDNGPELRRMVPDLENRAREAVAS